MPRFVRDGMKGNRNLVYRSGREPMLAAASIRLGLCFPPKALAGYRGSCFPRRGNGQLFSIPRAKILRRTIGSHSPSRMTRAIQESGESNPQPGWHHQPTGQTRDEEKLGHRDTGRTRQETEIKEAEQRNVQSEKQHAPCQVQSELDRKHTGQQMSSRSRASHTSEAATTVIA